MGITLDLPQYLEKALAAKADRLGLSLNEYLLQILATGQQAEVGIQTGAELVAYWQRENLIGARSDIKDSQQHARRIREQAEKRMRQ